jgi:hypothetical protein
MEADWEFEIGGDAPVIETEWAGFVDLRVDSSRIADLVECRELPALAEALVRLNAACSPVWTSKTDLFVPDHVDADELDATGAGSGEALACYIDLLPSDAREWKTPGVVELNLRQICVRLRGVKLRDCRVDLVVRRAFAGAVVRDPAVLDLGVTAYLTAIGNGPDAAKARLSECLTAFVDVLIAKS